MSSCAALGQLGGDSETRGRRHYADIIEAMAPNASTCATSPTVNEYDATYGSEAGWEYWLGEARHKPAPTKFHGILQILLADLLRLAGYISTVEAELRNVRDWHPRPDVYGVLEEFEGAYPSRPVDVVFEVVSDQEDMSQCASTIVKA